MEPAPLLPDRPDDGERPDSLAVLATVGRRNVTDVGEDCGSGRIPISVRVLPDWFPLLTWREIPFLDDWPIRYQSAYDLMRLLDRGSFTGWEWRFLGGYHSSSDATQGLGTLTFLPMRILGPTLGFHVLHVLLFTALPALVWLDFAAGFRGAGYARAMDSGGTRSRSSRQATRTRWFGAATPIHSAVS